MHVAPAAVVLAVQPGSQSVAVLMAAASPVLARLAGNYNQRQANSNQRAQQKALTPIAAICQLPANLTRPRYPPHPSHQVLESVVRTRWGALPDAQREGIKTYCSNLIIKISTDDKAFRSERTFLNKLNLVRPPHAVHAVCVCARCACNIICVSAQGGCWQLMHHVACSLV